VNDLNERQVTTTSREVGSDRGVDEEISVQIIATTPAMRSGLAALIDTDDRFRVSGVSRNATEAVNQIEATPGSAPDIIIAVLDDGSTPEFDEFMKTREAPFNPAVVALIPDWQSQSVISLLRSGASSLLPITATGDEIIAALEAAFAGLVVFHRDMLEVFELEGAPQESHHENSALDPDQSLESLTPRELQILAMMAEGLGNKEIAWQLKISDHTAKFHVSSILGKLGASSRTEAVTLGLRRGLITL
jgi:DNA-binding NarL/FixJ family response regulator